MAKENTNSLVLKEFLGSLVLHNRLTWNVCGGGAWGEHLKHIDMVWGMA